MLNRTTALCDGHFRGERRDHGILPADGLFDLACLERVTLNDQDTTCETSPLPPREGALRAYLRHEVPVECRLPAALDEGIAGFLQKPYSISDLLRELHLPLSEPSSAASANRPR